MTDSMLTSTQAPPITPQEVPEYKVYALAYRSDLTPKISIDDKCF